MEFKLPPVHDIFVEIDGRRFDGSWYVILGEMIVNYNGSTLSISAPATGAHANAEKMLKDLIRTHYISLDSIPNSLPQLIKEAAHAYVNSFDDDQPTHELVSSFGSSIAGSEVHRQLSWLCVNVIGMIVPSWKDMCDGDAPERTYRDLRRWLDDTSHPVDWSSAEHPSPAMRAGIRVHDCDACRLEPTADAVARTAVYLRSADSTAAVDALLSAASAYDEGCHSHESPDRFEKWLVFDVLKAAFECRSPE